MARRMNLVHSEKKRELVEALLDKGMTLVALDGRYEGVDLPEHLRGDPQVRLNLSYRFGLPIEVGEEGVRATLTFGGVPHDCKLPWKSIYLAHSHVSQEQYLFLADVPDALLPGTPVEPAAEGAEAVEAEAEEAPVTGTPVKRPRFAVVEGGAAGGEPAAEGDQAQESREPRPAAPHLRRIK